MTATSLREREGDKYGGSPEGIRHHYDVSNGFWPLVLGPTMAYSCALFASRGEQLDVAQNRKLSWHAVRAGTAQAKSVLDIGCGWGALLAPLSREARIERIVGLTLSPAQVEYVQELAFPKVEVRLESWTTHSTPQSYDSIISIGAFEHFAKREETSVEKIAVYRDFFDRCRSWLSPSGSMTLQTIAYGNMSSAEASTFMQEEIFPDSELPTLADIVAAAEGIFEIVELRNDRLHYALTTDHWAQRLRANRAAAAQEIGEERVQKMLRYFKLVSMGFRMGKQHLLRLALRPVTRGWSAAGTQRWGATDDVQSSL